MNTRISGFCLYLCKFLWVVQNYITKTNLYFLEGSINHFLYIHSYGHICMYIKKRIDYSNKLY